MLPWEYLTKAWVSLSFIQLFLDLNGRYGKGGQLEKSRTQCLPGFQALAIPWLREQIAAFWLLAVTFAIFPLGKNSHWAHYRLFYFNNGRKSMKMDLFQPIFITFGFLHTASHFTLEISVLTEWIWIQARGIKDTQWNTTDSYSL